MIKHILINFICTSLIVICMGSILQAQNVEGKVTNIFGEPLAGATILWENTSKGTTTDENGEFVIEVVNSREDYLVFSYLGYKNERIQPKAVPYWNIQLLEDNTLATVDISAKSKATRFADDAAKIEVIGTREIERAACCSLAGCFSTNASVQSMTTNILTDSKELMILGLSGVYNQILVDGVPLVQGIALPFGSGSYPGTIIDNIFISKGANSVLQGAQGIAGQINIITKSADQNPRLFLNAFANSFGESQYNANYIIKKEKWNNLLSVHMTSPAGIYDRNDDNYRDVVSTERFSIYNKWTIGKPDVTKFKGQISGRYWQEKRVGGMINFDSNLQQREQAAYGQVVNINHSDITTKFSYSLSDDVSITTINSGFYQENEDIYGLRDYNADQLNINSNLMLDYFYGAENSNLKVGISNVRNDINQEIVQNSFDDIVPTSTTRDIADNVFGAFVENIYNAKPFTVILGLRTDKFGEHGWKTSPRILIRSEIKENLDVRFSAGKGYRNAYPLAERSNLLSNNRRLIIDENLTPEEAINIGLNGVYQHFFSDVDMTISADGYHTIFQNQIFPHFDQGIFDVHIHNFYGTTVSNSFQIEQKFEVLGRYDFKWAYNYLDVYRIQPNGRRENQNFVTKHQWMANASYATEDDKWQADLTYRWTGSMQLPSTAGFPAEYQREEQSPSFSNLDMQLTKRWSKFEVYGGVENIFNFRQLDPILAGEDPHGQFFNTIFNWGPIKGREVYVGLRFRID